MQNLVMVAPGKKTAPLPSSFADIQGYLLPWRDEGRGKICAQGGSCMLQRFNLKSEDFSGWRPSTGIQENPTVNAHTINLKRRGGTVSPGPNATRRGKVQGSSLVLIMNIDSQVGYRKGTVPRPTTNECSLTKGQSRNLQQREICSN